MKISARTVLSGKAIALTLGATTAHVKIEIATGAAVAASITTEAVDALGLASRDRDNCAFACQRNGLQQARRRARRLRFTRGRSRISR
jgi:molybdopterin-binding protein